MSRLLVTIGTFGIVIGIGCGGRTNEPGPDGGTGSPTGTGGGGAGGATVGGAGGATVGGSGGATVGGTGGTTVGGTGGTAVGGSGGTTVGGSGGAMTVGGVGGGSPAGGAGGVGGAGGASDFSACSAPGQCELAPSKCCACGVLPIDQVTAVNTAKRGEFNRFVCGNMGPCPPCVGVPDPNLGALCESAKCAAFDIRKDPTFTKCGGDQDCTLRKGLGCCECNSTGEWVAISKVGTMVLTPQVCGPASACPGCIPSPPAGWSAVCQNGACTLRTQ